MDFGENARMIQGGFSSLDQGMEANRQERKKEEEKNRPLSPYEQHVAHHIHRLLFGQEPVDQIIASYKNGAPTAQPQPQMMGARGMSPAPYPQPQPQGPGMAPSTLNQMGAPPQPVVRGSAPEDQRDFMREQMGMAPPPGGAMQGPVPAYNSPDAPPPPAPSDQIQGGLRQMPAASTARSPVSAMPQPPAQGPDGNVPPEPRTRADFEALMNFAHSGVPGALQRSQDVERRLSSVEQQNALNRISRENIASAGNDTKKGIASATEQGRSERAQLNAETRRQIASDAMSEAHRKATLEHMDRVAAIQQRADAVSQRISAAIEKGDSSELNAAEKELHEAESELKTEVGAQTKFSGQAATSLVPEQQKAAKALADAAQVHVDAARKKIDDAQKKVDEAKAAKKSKTKASASMTTKSGGGAMINVIRKSDGAPGRIPEANFDPAKYTKQ